MQPCTVGCKIDGQGILTQEYSKLYLVKLSFGIVLFCKPSLGICSKGIFIHVYKGMTKRVFMAGLGGRSVGPPPWSARQVKCGSCTPQGAERSCDTAS